MHAQALWRGSGAAGASFGASTSNIKLRDDSTSTSTSTSMSRQLWRSAHHRDWVVALQPLPQLEALLAASLDKSLSIMDLERSVALRMLSGIYTPDMQSRS
jgi:hypothetical protein